MKTTSKKFVPCLLAALSLALSGAVTGVQAQGDPLPKDATGPQARPSAGTPTAINKASTLLGMTVRNPRGEDLGRVKDLVIDPSSGRVAYVVLGVGGRAGGREKLLAVPMKAFTAGPDHTYLVLNSDRQSIAQARGFDPNDWPAIHEQVWGAQPFWKEPSATPPSPAGSVRHGPGMRGYNPGPDIFKNNTPYQDQFHPIMPPGT